jgi:hypothetical protein
LLIAVRTLDFSHLSALEQAIRNAKTALGTRITGTDRGMILDHAERELAEYQQHRH